MVVRACLNLKQYFLLLVGDAIRQETLPAFNGSPERERECVGPKIRQCVSFRTARHVVDDVAGATTTKLLYTLADTDSPSEEYGKNATTGRTPGAWGPARRCKEMLIFSGAATSGASLPSPLAPTKQFTRRRIGTTTREASLRRHKISLSIPSHPIVLAGDGEPLRCSECGWKLAFTFVVRYDR